MKTYSLLCAALCLLAVACKKDNNKYVLNNGLQPDDIIRFVSISPMPAAADSFSKIIVRVAINSHSDDDAVVTLSTDQGIINGSSASESQTVNLSRYADFVLTTGRTYGPVKLKTTVSDSLSRDTIIYFAKAYPDSVILQPEQQVVAKNETVTLNINLFRTSGYPSAHQAIFCRAIDSMGNNAGSFNSIADFIPGQRIQTVFTPVHDFTGAATLQVFVIKEDGGAISGKTVVHVRE